MEAQSITLVARGERRLRVLLLGAGVGVLGALAGLGAPGRGARLTWAAHAIAPLLPLGAGLSALERGWRHAPVLILGGLPAALAVSTLAQGAPRVALEPVVFWIEAAALLAFVVQAARLIADVERPTVAAQGGAAPAPTRLVRRGRIHRVLRWAAVSAFAWPLAIALLPGAASARIGVAAAGLLGALTCRAFLIDPLERHLQHDPALVEDLARLRRHARRGRPGPVLYLAAGAALIAMGVLLSRNLLGLSVPTP